jgi:hypothetical protein
MRSHEFISRKLEDRHPNDKPFGPESRPRMPAGTVRVDVSDVYDWYKLGQHVSNLKGLGRHDFGKGPPSTIFSFGDEDTEHKYIKDLERTGLKTTDIDPAAHGKKTGQKTDPTYDVGEGLGVVLRAGDLVDVFIRGVNKGNPVTRLITRGIPNSQIPALLKVLEKKYGINPNAVVYGPSQVVKEVKPQAPLEVPTPAQSSIEQSAKAINVIDQTLDILNTKQSNIEKEIAALKADLKKLSYAPPAGSNVRYQGSSWAGKDSAGRPIAGGPIGQGQVKEARPKKNKKKKRTKFAYGGYFFPGYSFFSGDAGGEGGGDGGGEGMEENFADGKKPGRKGLAKRVGVDCKQPVAKLRSIASNSSGERQRMAHWCANMKSGKKRVGEQDTAQPQQDQQGQQPQPQQQQGPTVKDVLGTVQTIGRTFNTFKDQDIGAMVKDELIQLFKKKARGEGY